MKSRFSFNNIFKKAIVTVVCCISLTTLAVRPLPAKASGIPTVDIAAILEGIGQFFVQQYNRVTDNLYNELAATFWNNGVQQFVNNLVIETATWIASGDEGQKAGAII